MPSSLAPREIRHRCSHLGWHRSRTRSGVDPRTHESRPVAPTATEAAQPARSCSRRSTRRCRTRLNAINRLLEQQRRREQISICFLSAQRTAVKQRPHQQTERRQVGTSESVVLHHGREARRCSWRRGAAVCFNGLLGGTVSKR